MPAPVYNRTIFASAALFVGGILTMAQLARDEGMPIGQLRKQLKAIVAGDLETFHAWLDAVPGRRAAWDATIAANEADSERLTAELEAMMEDDGLIDLAEPLDD